MQRDVTRTSLCCFIYITQIYGYFTAPFVMFLFLFICFRNSRQTSPITLHTKKIRENATRQCYTFFFSLATHILSLFTKSFIIFLFYHLPTEFPAHLTRENSLLEVRNMQHENDVQIFSHLSHFFFSVAFWISRHT